MFNMVTEIDVAAALFDLAESYLYQGSFTRCQLGNFDQQCIVKLIGSKKEKNADCF